MWHLTFQAGKNIWLYIHGATHLIYELQLLNKILSCSMFTSCTFLCPEHYHNLNTFSEKKSHIKIWRDVIQTGVHKWTYSHFQFWAVFVCSQNECKQVCHCIKILDCIDELEVKKALKKSLSGVACGTAVMYSRIPILFGYERSKFPSSNDVNFCV